MFSVLKSFFLATCWKLQPSFSLQCSLIYFFCMFLCCSFISYSRLFFTLSKICCTFAAGTQPSRSIFMVPETQILLVSTLKRQTCKSFWHDGKFNFRLPSSIFRQLTTVDPISSLECPSHSTPCSLCPRRLSKSLKCFCYALISVPLLPERKVSFLQKTVRITWFTLCYLSELQFPNNSYINKETIY